MLHAEVIDPHDKNAGEVSAWYIDVQLSCSDSFWGSNLL